MFRSLTIKSKESDNLPIDIGFLAESLLFYNTVNFLGNKDSISGLFTLCGVEEVAELIKTGRLVLYVREDNIATSIFPGDIETYDIQKWSDTKFNKEQYLHNILVDFVGDESDLKKYVQFFTDHAFVHQYDNTIVDEINSDLFDTVFLSTAISSLINYYQPGIEVNVEARYYQIGQFGPFSTYRLDTNLNLEKYNLTPSGILLSIAESRGNIQIAGNLNSEIADKPIYSVVVRNKFDELINKFEKNQNGISNFQDVVMDNYGSIGNALLHKEKTFGEFMHVLEKADKFKEWLSKVEDNRNIISEYYNAVMKDTWLEKLPSKPLRFGIFTGTAIVLDILLAGGLGTAIGVSLSAGDAFILDKLIKGWKPNQFIDDTVKPFVGEKSRITV